jgi:hypothetical protein
MIGAGIFALLGEAGTVAGSAVWLSFLLAGIGFFAVDTLRNAPQTFTAIVAIALLAVVLDLVWKRVRPTPEPSRPGEDGVPGRADG